MGHLYDLAVTCTAWFSALQCLGRLLLGALGVAQFVAVTIQLSRYFNALRVQRVLLLMDALDEQLLPLSSTLSSTASRLSMAHAEALLGIQADLEDLLDLLHDRGQRCFWILVHGSRLDGLLADFERVLISTTHSGGLN
ncbi:unnamed protein product [Calypogeia fissa]